MQAAHNNYQNVAAEGARDRFLSVAEVTRILGISRTTLYSWLGKELLPRQRRIGPRRVGFLSSEIAEFIQSRKVA
jgi:predicted DNA-binding transcriptional regulator AlpA